jgi:hypothetical protein
MLDMAILAFLPLCQNTLNFVSESWISKSRPSSSSRFRRAASRPASCAALMTLFPASSGLKPLALFILDHLHSVSVTRRTRSRADFLPLVLGLVIKLLLLPLVSSNMFQTLALGGHNVFLVLLRRHGPTLGFDFSIERSKLCFR